MVHSCDSYCIFVLWTVIEEATDETNVEDNWSLILDVCDHAKQSPAASVLIFLYLTTPRIPQSRINTNLHKYSLCGELLQNSSIKKVLKHNKQKGELWSLNCCWQFYKLFHYVFLGFIEVVDTSCLVYNMLLEKSSCLYYATVTGTLWAVAHIFLWCIWMTQ